jgi:aspartate/methionine/tyrosine aminotransferase
MLGTDSAFDLLAEVNRLRATGRDVISFGIGEPDFATPANVIAAAHDALDRGRTKYGPSEGLPELRHAIAMHVSATRGIPVEPDQVVVAPGAKPIIFYTLAALVNPGEEVLYPNPGFPTYESLIRWIGAVPVPMPLSEANRFGCDHEALVRAVSDRTKLIILNSPNNPTGGVLTEADLVLVAKLAERHNCWILSDEIYSRLVFDGPFRSIASFPRMQERTIILDGFSKSYAMTGWRLGYGVASEELAPLLARVETNVESCTNTFIQLAGVEALNGPQDEAERSAAELRARAQLTVDLLNQIDGVHCVQPRGAFYAFPNVTEVCRRRGYRNAEDLAHDLLHEAGVAVMPRAFFGARNEGEAEEYVRLSFATSTELIREGIARMRSFLP